MIESKEVYHDVCHYHHKLEKRTYTNGITRWYVLSGGKWWPINKWLVDIWIKKGAYVLDTGIKDHQTRLYSLIKEGKI